jgi:hypothetical protein
LRRAESPTWSDTGSTGSRSRRSITPSTSSSILPAENEVDLVMVDGEVIEQSGKLTRIDGDAIIDEIHAAHERIEPMLTASEAEVEELVVPYERIYRRCQCMDIAKDTYPARFSH